MGCGGSKRKKAAIVTVGADKKAVGLAAAKFIAAEATKAIAANGKFTVAFSGGSLPKIVGPALSELKVSNTEEWYVFFSDERCVALTSDDSNFKSVQEHVVVPLSIPNDNVLAIDAKEFADPVKAAELYETALKKSFSGTEMPSFDLILLGMGPDGHTCSLFPGHSLLSERGRLIASLSDSPKPPPSRITFTYPVLNSAKAVAFVCTGGGKSTALKSVIEGPPSGEDMLPSGRIENEVHWFVDADAAKELSKDSISEDA